MSNIYLGSAAQVVKPGLIKIITAKNPEDIFVDYLASYIKDLGYSEMMPNFDGVNIGTVSPFAQLLFQEIQGLDTDLNVFPSITVADMDQNETADVIGDSLVEAAVDSATVAWLKAERSAGNVFISDTNMSNLEAGTADGKTVSSTRRTVTKQDSFMFMLWSENKSVVSFLFDIVGAFLMDKKIEMHKEGIDITNHSGSRTGDINLEFGSILYGASYSVATYVQQTTMTVDVDLGVVTGITVAIDPTSSTGSQATTNVIADIDT